MQHSFSFYITTWILKQLGLKKIFSTDPIDFIKLRKNDVFYPKSKSLKQKVTQKFTVLKSEITELSNDTINNKLVLFIHGGALISGPGQHHWDSIQKIIEKTDYNIWMCNYPKAPEHKILEINQNIDAVYKLALEKFEAKNIVLIGDSAGGNLILTLIQRLIKEKKETPKKVIAISPVVDAAFTNPKIDLIDKKDLMLSKKGVLSAKKMAAGDLIIDDESISPINGSFIGFPELYLFLAEYDITFPDQELLVKKLNQEKVKAHITIGKSMPHIWPLLPIMKESKIGLEQIIEILKN